MEQLIGIPRAAIQRKPTKQVRLSKAELIQRMIDAHGLNWTVRTNGMVITIDKSVPVHPDFWYDAS